MSTAAHWFRFLLLIGFALSEGRAAEGSVRAIPSRPGGTPAPATSTPVPASAASSAATRKIGGIDYVSTVEVASVLDLKLTWLERGRKILLTGGSARAEIENDTRDITVNGLRVFLGDAVVDAGGQLYVSRVDFERCLTPLLRPGHGMTARPALKTIVLDPGHGGRDNGTSALEKTYALDVAQRVKKLLEPAGYNIVLTRDRDVYLDLPERSAVANANRAGLFVSIHFNAIARDRKTSGVEVFTFAPQFQRSTNAWSPGSGNDAEKEPAPVNRFDHWSSILAHAIQRRFVNDLKSFDRGKKIAHWGVLRGLSCPGVLVECGFLTSDAEARKIATPQHRQRLATALAAAIRDYASATDGVRAQASAAAIRRQNSVRTTH